MSKSSSTGGIGKIVACLFALVFFVTGLTVAGVGVWQFVVWTQTQSWVECQATVRSVERVVHSTGKSEDYWSEIRPDYSYEVDGVAYRGRESAKFPRALQKQAKKMQVLERHAKNGEPTICYVNPSNPQEAVLYRELYSAGILVRLAFGSIFALLPVVLFALARRASKSEKRYEELKTQHPKEPWLWQDDWGTGVIESSQWMGVRVAAGLAVIWNLFSIAFVAAMWEQMQSDLVAFGGVLLMPVLPGICLIGWFLFGHFRQRKFGKSSLQLGTLPGVIGGPFSAVVRAEKQLDPEFGVRATLYCNQWEMRGAGKQRRLVQESIWQDVKVITPQATSNDGESVIPIQFAIPFDAKQTDGKYRTDDSTSWNLEIAAEQPGIDYKASFTVPVFRTEKSSPEYKPEESAVSRFEQVQTVADEYRRMGLLRKKSPHELEVTFPMFRNIGNSLVATFATVFILAVTLGVGYAAWKEKGLGIGGTFLFAMGIFIGVLMLWGCLDSWFRKTKVTASQHALAIRSGLFGLGREQRFTKDEIQSVFSKPYGPNNHSPMFDIVLKTKDGKELRFGKRIADVNAPPRIAADIADAIGVEDDRSEDIRAVADGELRESELTGV